MHMWVKNYSTKQLKHIHDRNAKIILDVVHMYTTYTVHLYR
jgi:hypothetical protein